MPEKKSRIRVRFKESEYAEDWVAVIYATEPVSVDDARNLIGYWAEVNERNVENYCPTDILNDLCENKGWDWSFDDEEDIVLEHGEW